MMLYVHLFSLTNLWSFNRWVRFLPLCWCLKADLPHFHWVVCHWWHYIPFLRVNSHSSQIMSGSVLAKLGVSPLAACSSPCGRERVSFSEISWYVRCGLPSLTDAVRPMNAVFCQSLVRNTRLVPSLRRFQNNGKELSRIYRQIWGRTEQKQRLLTLILSNSRHFLCQLDSLGRRCGVILVWRQS